MRYSYNSSLEVQLNASVWGPTISWGPGMGTAQPMAISPEEIEEVVDRLAADFQGIFGREEVERVVADSIVLLEDIRSAGLRIDEVRGFGRDRLLALGKLKGSLAAGTPAAVFVCVHNAGRSQMSAGWARHLAGERLLVFSGGSAPGEQVNPQAVEAMAEAGIDISQSSPQPFTDEIVRASDVVVTMGCGDACPYFPGKRYLDWELADPHDASLDEVRAVRDEIEIRIRRLLAEMGID